MNPRESTTKWRGNAPPQTGYPSDFQAGGTGATATTADETPAIIWPELFGEVLAEMLAGSYITHGLVRTDSGVLPLFLFERRPCAVGIVYGTGDAAGAHWKTAQHRYKKVQQQA